MATPTTNPAIAPTTPPSTTIATAAFQRRGRESSRPRPSTVTEVVGARERLPDRIRLRDRARERPQRLEPRDEHVAVLADPLEAAVREDERLRPNGRAVPVVHRRRNDQVDLAVLVLEQHEDDPIC